MEPVFTMQYGEFVVADYFSKRIKDASVFVPASAQEKGIDLLMYRFNNGNKTCTIQVKMSRTYYKTRKRIPVTLPYDLWFNRFPIQGNADWYVLVGIYAKRPSNTNTSSKGISWDSIMLAFTHDEMVQFMADVKKKKNPQEDDRMFGFSFDDSKQIFQTRGYKTRRDMTSYLIDNRLTEIQKSFK